MNETTHGFRGEYRFLSNFYPSPIVLSGILFPTAEHLYQAYKAVDHADMQAIAKAPNPRAAKSMGRDVKAYTTFQEDRLKIMRRVLYLKFKNNKDLRQKLIDTGDLQLIEYNGWNDRFWGVDLKGVGENHLGKLLMGLRDNFTKDSNYVDPN